MTHSSTLSIFALATLLLLGACGGDAPVPASDSSATAEAEDPDAPGVYEMAPGEYEVVLHAFNGGFDPAEIRVPAGSEVTFRATSRDDPHGLFIEGTDVRTTLTAGSWVEETHTFDEPGEQMFLCDEYCGGGHDSMRGVVIVE